MSNLNAQFWSRYRVAEGKHLRVHQLDTCVFDHVAAMLLEHFDHPAFRDTVFVLGQHRRRPISYFREIHPGKRIVVYQLEQVMGCNEWAPIAEVVESLRGADEVWDFDPLNVEVLRWNGVKVDRVVPMLHSASLRRFAPRPEPRTDVLFAGNLNPRRQRIFTDLQFQLPRETRFKWVSGFEGDDLDDLLADTKIVLNLHAFEPYNRQEQVRIFYPLINGVMVVSETSERNWMGDEIVEADPAHLGGTLAHWLADDRWRGFGPAAAERYRQRTALWLADRGATPPAPPRQDPGTPQVTAAIPRSRLSTVAAGVVRSVAR